MSPSVRKPFAENTDRIKKNPNARANSDLKFYTKKKKITYSMLNLYLLIA